MRRVVVWLVAGAVTLALCGVALAGPKKRAKKVRSKFYDFGEQVVDGKRLAPSVQYTSSRRRVTPLNEVICRDELSSRC